MKIKVDLEYCNECPKHSFKHINYQSGFSFGLHKCTVNDKVLNDFILTYENNFKIPTDCPNKIK